MSDMYGLHKNSVAYAATSMASSMMISVFGFAYVKVFLNNYKIQESWFQLSQVCYMIWNAVNDPLFGYFQDKSQIQWIRSRRLSILYGAPVWAISFIVPWFGWGDESTPWVVGMHLMFSLCFWDTLLTFVLLAQCALFAELSSKHEDRLRLIRYSVWASLLGSTSVSICVYASDNLTNFGTFQFLSIVIAVCAFFLMRYSANNVQTRYDLQDLSNINRSDSSPDLQKITLSTASSKEAGETGKNNFVVQEDSGYLKLTWNILKDRDFLSFVLTNFCQILQMTLSGSFTAIVGDALVPKDSIPGYVRSFWYGAMFFLPQVIVILGTPYVGMIGYFKVIRSSFVVKVFLSLFMYFIGYDQQWKLWLLILYMIIDSSITNAVFSLFNMPLSDVIDDDMNRNKRSRPLSSMVFATNALITKPAQSVAPMVAVAVLNAYGYEQYKEGKLTSPTERSQLHDSMFTLITLSTLFLASLQLLIWSLYRNRNSHENVPKYTEGTE